MKVKSSKRWRGWPVIGFAVGIAAPMFEPALLAFPHSEQVGEHQVYSVEPITPAVRQAVAEADRRVAASPLGSARPLDQDIFLTDGGWRWTWLAGNVQGAFGLSRAVNETIVLGAGDMATAMLRNGAPIGGERSIASIVAHEMTHGSIRAHFGWTADFTYPAELREGYCEYVAGESSLSDPEALSLQQRGQSHPALIYWSGRKRVEAEMARPGASVDRLFVDWKAAPGG
jgi:hypothetical protein